MLRIFGYRLAGAVPVLLLVTLAIFALLRLAPGDAASALASDDASPEEIMRLRAQWGLDQPVIVQFFLFLRNALRFDFGMSYRYNDAISSLIADRLPATIELAIVALFIAVVIAVPLGVYTALHKGKWLDSVGSIFAVAGVSAPAFWVGILLVLFFSEHLNLLPSGGRLPVDSRLAPGTGLLLIDGLLQGRWAEFGAALRHLVLPAVTLALGMLGIIMRITRSSIIDVGQDEFITTAVAKGVRRQDVITRHLMPNAAIPILTIIGLEMGTLISGSIIVEVVFSWPGLGSLLYQAVTVRDLPLTTGIVVTYTFAFIILNLCVDAAYMFIDPRLRERSGSGK